MYIAVIGGGGAGLCAVRHILEEENTRCVLFEQNDSIGGTWVYTDFVGVNEHGLPVHSSIYKKLKTNLPKESMRFPDFDFKKSEESYVSREVVLEYLNDYANNYNLRSHIKLNHHVRNIKRVDNKWNVFVINLINKQETTYEFDAVFVCNGHYSNPIYPKIQGMDTFTGTQIHSHDFRVSKPFEDKKVLIIGAGPSGLDLACDVATVAKQVVWSYHSKLVDPLQFPQLLHKPDVKFIRNSSVEFVNDTEVDDVDAIIYSTGYNYWYPFLDESCGISVEDCYVTPLYKSTINIHNPTMCFVGIAKLVPQFPSFDLQVRYILKLLKTGVPSKQNMLQELENFEQEKRKLNIPKNKYYNINIDDQRKYLDSLVKETGIEPLPEIIIKIHLYALMKIFSNFTNFRKDAYKVVNENEFKVLALEK